MLATFLVRPGKIELREIPQPTPARGEVLIQIKTALTCGTDLKAFRRGHPMIPMPGALGHEFSGIVAETGKGVRRFREGDAIMAVHSGPCLQCVFCRIKLYNLCEHIMRTKVLGAFSEYLVLPSHIVRQNAFRKPAALSFEEAAFLEPLSCVVHGMSTLDIKKGAHALIFGAGPVGLLHLLLLKEKKAIVTIADKHDSKLRIAKNLGADFVWKNTPPVIKKGRREIVRRNTLTDFIGFDYVFECTGMPGVWEASVYYARKGGTVMLFGGCKSSTTVAFDAGKLHYDEITLKGTFHYTPDDVKKAYGLLGRLGVSRLVSGRYPLTSIQKAFEKLSEGAGIKYAIIP
ncbi:MAG: alcohol dehydrogenase catalytic domain-containing protein [Nitrospirota bacterium]